MKAWTALHADEQGSATIWTAWACVALVTLAGWGLLLAAGLHARHEVALWADGAALAGAAEVRQGDVAVCRQAAQWVRQETKGRIQSCSVITHPDTGMPAAQVEVMRDFGRFTLTGRACAGPVPR